jgi:hypothetical protein
MQFGSWAASLFTLGAFVIGMPTNVGGKLRSLIGRERRRDCGTESDDALHTERSKVCVGGTARRQCFRIELVAFNFVW